MGMQIIFPTKEPIVPLPAVACFIISFRRGNKPSDPAENPGFWRKFRMKSRIRLFAWVIPSIVVLSACSISPNAAAAGSKTVSTREPIFQDDFSGKSGGWDSLTDEYGTTDYSDGKYLISVADSNSFLFSIPGVLSDSKDVRIEVDILKSDNIQHDMGIICRYQDSDNFYYLVVSSDGYYAIGKFKDGTEELIGSTDMQQDNAGVINTGAADNHLRGDCVGNTLTLYANGSKLFQAQDSDFAKGNVGLIAGSYDDTPIAVYFDNLIVTKP
jgi:hypothetical protein